MIFHRSDGERSSRFRTATEFGTFRWAWGYMRRRAGLILTRIRHPRVQFGRLCDVGRRSRFLVARRARTRFGTGCIIDEGFTLENRGRIEAGHHTVFGHHCTVAADASIVIGHSCLIGEMVSIRDNDHQFSAPNVMIVDQGRKTAPIRIGENVRVGAKATITTGVSIGPNTVIGAHAVVTGDLPANCVAVGIPAKVIRYRGTRSPVVDTQISEQSRSSVSGLDPGRAAPLPRRPPSP